jgi:glucose-6-phosphate 1-dehydrogenase
VTDIALHPDRLADQRKPDPCSFVIFGVTGDLTHRLVIPSLYNLAATNLLPDKFCVVGVARKGTSNDALRDSLMKGLRQFATRPVHDAVAQRLLECVTSIEADPRDPASFDALRERLERLEANRETGGNRLFYLATPPDAFAPISRELGRTGLLKEDRDKRAWRRLVIEKPFGTDLASAKVLDTELLKIVDEHQIYRIDHYLGKETVQNILVLRFANGMFEPIWNRDHIDHVQITVDEKLGVGHRGSFYDATGALRDMVPNHLFQLLSLAAMEPPIRFDAHSVRSEKADVLAAIQIQSEEEALRNSVRGQYLGGKIGDTEIPDYHKTEDVKPGSTTETYVALKLTIDNWRWAGVPFYLRTGKALPHRASEIAVQFKDIPQILFNANAQQPQPPNVLALRIQPGEGLSLRIVSRVPGTRAQTHPVEMDFQYSEVFGRPSPEAYERLLLDVMAGDASRFMRRDAVEASWAWITEILEGWHRQGLRWLPEYPAGTCGPVEADRLIEKDGRTWRTL